MSDDHLCRLSDFKGSGVLVRFDGGEVDNTWSLIFMSNDRKGLIIDHKEMEFIQKLKKSKNVKIQVNLENVGRNTFEFNTAGLKWDYDS